jgi:hypothetical protein
VPQQARAAIDGTQMPDAGGSTYLYMIGSHITEYTSYPDPNQNPLARPYPPSAEVWVFSTFPNPFNPSVELLPLYRLSWKCGDNGRASTCATNPSHVSHLYSANLNETIGFLGQGYSFDAIEGYVVPVEQPQPAGTTQLRRAYDPANDDYVTYPIDLEAGWYPPPQYQNPITIGYVFYNNGSRPSY